MTESNVLKEFRPEKLLPSLMAGLVVGIMTILVQLSFASLIFSGDLAGYISRGIGFTLFGALAMQTVATLLSSFPGMISLPQDSPAALLAISAGVIAGQMAAAPKEALFATVVAAIILASVLTGLFSLALGTFKLGGLVRYIPYPVIGGFLAGTGWLLASGAVGVMAGVSPHLSTLPRLFLAEVLVKWLPGVLFAFLLLAILRRISHFLIIPGMVLALFVSFYLVAGIVGLSPAEAGAQGWLLGPIPQGGLWYPLEFEAWKLVDWRVLLSQVGSLGAVMLISTISMLLNASGIEVTARRDLDLNRELRVNGWGNLAAGLVGSHAGYPALSFSVLGLRVGVNSRLIGVFALLLVGSMLFFGASLLNYFPKMILGGLLFFLGLAFLVEWLYDAWFKLSRIDYLIVVLIMVTMGTVGVMEGVGLGLGLAVVLFVFEYSRIDVVKHCLTGNNFHSTVERPRLYENLLRKKGDWLYILELQGFIFFGTANRLLERVRQRIQAENIPTPRFILLDFRQVNGLDASAVVSFTKIRQLTQAHQIILIFTDLKPRLRHQLENDIFLESEQAFWHIEPDLDHGMEWCEEQIIHTFEEVGLQTRPMTARMKQRLQEGRSGPPHPGLADLYESSEAPQLEPLPVAGLEKYMERIEVGADHVLIRQGDISKNLYYIASGQVTVQLEGQDETLRIRKTGPGTVVGEMGIYLGKLTSAQVVTTQPSVIYRMSADDLDRMEQEAPLIAATFHRYIAQMLCERVLSTTSTLQAMLK
ncbi:MAG: SulP family inorganic anion transporter [Chloroflexota bacterium]